MGGIGFKFDNVSGTLHWNNQLLLSTTGAINSGADPGASYLVMAATASLANERALTAGTGIRLTDGGAGGNATLSVSDGIVATISGATFNGAVKFSAGLSGSLQNLSDGTSYLVAGSNVTITSQSNGQITISSTGGGGSGADPDVSYLVVANTASLSNERALAAGTGLKLSDGGANSSLTLSVNDNVVATVSGTKFTGVVELSGTTGDVINLTIKQPPATLGTPHALKVTGGAHTTLAAGDLFDVDLDTERTVQFTSGALISAVGALRVKPPTYDATAPGQVISKAATILITGEPSSTANVDVEESYSFDVNGRTNFFADKPTGSDTDYSGLNNTVELGGGTQSAPIIGLQSSFRTVNGALLVSGGYATYSAFFHGSTTSSLEANGVRATVLGSGAGVSLGTITDAWAVSAAVGYVDVDGLPASGTITNAACFRAVEPPNTSVSRVITNMRGVHVPNLGATGVDAIVGVDIEAQSGASSTNLGIRSAAPVQVNSTVEIKTHSAFAGSGMVARTGAVQTSDATQTTVASFTLDDSTVYWFRASVVGRATGGTKRAAYVITCLAYREGGGATLGAVNVQNDFQDETTAAWDATFTVSGNDIRVSVTGESSTTINWACTLERQGVSGNT